jgi:hypothetical protein
MVRWWSRCTCPAGQRSGRRPAGAHIVFDEYEDNYQRIDNV